jgi:hypothetical protein
MAPLIIKIGDNRPSLHTTMPGDRRQPTQSRIKEPTPAQWSKMMAIPNFSIPREGQANLRITLGDMCVVFLSFSSLFLILKGH